MGGYQHPEETRVKAVELYKSGKKKKEVAKKFGVSGSTLWNWEKDYDAGKFGKMTDTEQQTAPKPKEGIPLKNPRLAKLEEENKALKTLLKQYLS